MECTHDDMFMQHLQHIYSELLHHIKFMKCDKITHIDIAKGEAGGIGATPGLECQANSLSFFVGLTSLHTWLRRENIHHANFGFNRYSWGFSQIGEILSLRIFLPCDCELIRTVLLWTVRPSVCQTRELWQNEIIICKYTVSYTHLTLPTIYSV